MSNIGQVPEELNVGRGDPAYMAHAYLTKVPVPAIEPFIAAYCPPGGVVADPFAGSGMTGVAAAMLGRSAYLSDISVLGQHIGRNFVNLVDPGMLFKYSDEVVTASQAELGDLYRVSCSRCGGAGSLVKAVWSVVVECIACERAVNYYWSMESAEWRKPDMVCEHCGAGVNGRNRRVGEAQVLDSIACRCSPNQLDQQPSGEAVSVDLDLVDYPRVEISPDREMYKASALGKNGLTTIALFYSPRNLAVLTTLRRQIAAVESESIRAKLLFAFTACLTRASKRYQWSRQRPLNAANANYYVAAVFYEWNVYDLFSRKVQAIAKSDEYIRRSRRNHVGRNELDAATVKYEIGSADSIGLPDNSVDYVFTDPPFGSNLFYADMALFQEAWLDSFTDVTKEAVIDRSRGGQRTAARYEALLTGALRECRRVLRPGGRISMVFGNSSGTVWGLVQRSIANAGLAIEPDALVVLNKGQRSVKGLASGFEDTATLDLIITMRPAEGRTPEVLVVADNQAVATEIKTLAALSPATPSHLYLELLRTGIRKGWQLDKLDLRDVTSSLLDDGWEVDPKSGKLRQGAMGDLVAPHGTLW